VSLLVVTFLGAAQSLLISLAANGAINMGVFGVLSLAVMVLMLLVLVVAPRGRG
jgi:hypothetical protein